MNNSFLLHYLIFIVIAWLEYSAFRHFLGMLVYSVCSKTYMRKNCRGFVNKLFYTPVRERSRLGVFYYINIGFFWSVLALTVLPPLFGLRLFHTFFEILMTILITVLCVFSLFLAPVLAKEDDRNPPRVLSEGKIWRNKVLYIFQAIAMLGLWYYLTWFYRLPN